LARKFTLAQRVKGARKALRNRRTPAGLKKYLKKFIAKNG
jgi:hypothetical protein